MGMILANQNLGPPSTGFRSLEIHIAQGELPLHCMYCSYMAQPPIDWSLQWKGWKGYKDKIDNQSSHEFELVVWLCKICNLEHLNVAYSGRCENSYEGAKVDTIKSKRRKITSPSI